MPPLSVILVVKIWRRIKVAIIINCVLRDLIIFIVYVNFHSSCGHSCFVLFLVTFFFLFLVRREDALHTGSLSSRCITLQGVHDHTVLCMVWTHTCTCLLIAEENQKMTQPNFRYEKITFLCSFIGPYNICMQIAQFKFFL